MQPLGQRLVELIVGYDVVIVLVDLRHYLHDDGLAALVAVLVAAALAIDANLLLGEYLLQLVAVYRAVLVDVEHVEHLLDSLLVEIGLRGDGRLQEFVVVDLAITVLVERLHDELKFIVYDVVVDLLGVVLPQQLEEAIVLQAGAELLHGQGAVLVLVEHQEQLPYGLQLLLLLPHADDHRKDHTLEIRGLVKLLDVRCVLLNVPLHVLRHW